MPYPAQMPGLESLVQTFGVYNPETYQKARQTFDLSSQYNQQNLLDQRQAYDQKQVTNPLEAQRMGLDNEAQVLGNDAQRLKNQSMQRDWDVRPSADMERSAKLSKLAKEMSDDEVAGLENHIRSNALSLDPKVAAQARAQMLDFQDMVKAREQHKLQAQAAMERQREAGRTQRDVMQMQIDAGRFVKAPRSGSTPAKSLEELLPTIKDPVQRDGVLGTLIADAEYNGDQAAVARYTAMRAGNRGTAQATIDAKTTSAQGKPNVAAVAGMPAVQTPQLPQGGAPAKPGHSLAEVQKMYPGVPPEKLKQAYKLKFGVDLQ